MMLNNINITFKKLLRMIYNLFFKSKQIHRYDDVQYLIKNTWFKNGAVVASSVDKI